MRWSATKPPILTGRDSKPRLLECTGTRFLNKYINKLDLDYPFVDNVKPFNRFYRIFLRSAMAPDYGPLKATAAAWGILKYLSGTLILAPSDLLRADDAVTNDLYATMARFVERLPPAARQSFAERLTDCGLRTSKPLAACIETPDCCEALLDVVAEHLDLLDEIDFVPGDVLATGTVDDGTLSLYHAYNADETAELNAIATRLLQRNDIDIVIMGHTHEVVGRNPGSPYINPGCWTRCYRYEAGEPLRSWSILRGGSHERFPYELNFVEIDPEHVPSAYFKTFRSAKDRRV